MSKFNMLPSLLFDVEKHGIFLTFFKKKKKEVQIEHGIKYEVAKCPNCSQRLPTLKEELCGNWQKLAQFWNAAFKDV